MYKIKVSSKKGQIRESTNKRIKEYETDNFDIAVAFCYGLNAADLVAWRDRYIIKQV